MFLSYGFKIRYWLDGCVKGIIKNGFEHKKTTLCGSGFDFCLNTI